MNLSQEEGAVTPGEAPQAKWRHGDHTLGPRKEKEGGETPKLEMADGLI